MAHVYLITGGSTSERTHEIEHILQDTFSLGVDNILNIHQIDLLPGKNTIGIAEVSDISTFCTQRPSQSLHKALIVQNSHALTEQAQNALLKTLEDSPEYLVVLLSADSVTSLLPTVISRARQIKLAPSTEMLDGGQDYVDLYTQILQTKAHLRLELVEELAKEDKGVISATLNTWIMHARESLLAKPDTQDAQNLFVLYEVLETLENTNCNTKLALEYLVIHLL